MARLSLFFCGMLACCLLVHSSWAWLPSASITRGRMGEKTTTKTITSSTSTTTTTTTTTCMTTTTASAESEPLFSEMKQTADDKQQVKLCKKGDVVTIDCRLVPMDDFVPEILMDGVVLPSQTQQQQQQQEVDDEPSSSFVRLTFVLGQGNYLPGLHETILTTPFYQVDQTTTTPLLEGVILDAGWGDRNPNLVATVPFDKVGIQDKSQIRVGVELYLANGMKCIVTDVQDDSFTMDANPPMAGASYKADIRLIRVEPGPDITKGFDNDNTDSTTTTSRYEVATFALGCFWGGELEFMRQEGVVGTAVGYTQGQVLQPTYEQVCSGTTGHTEAIAVTYDPNVVSYETLVNLAMQRLGENKYLLHQVGNDRGTQYRHGVYYHTLAQKQVAERIVQSFGEKCRTECLPAQRFWIAEEYHQQYLLKGGQSARKGDDTPIRCYG